MANNFKTCEALLKKIKRKLVDQNVFKKYNEIFKDYESKKVIERLPKNEICKTLGEVHYLPHRLEYLKKEIQQKLELCLTIPVLRMDFPSMNVYIPV